MIFHDQIKLRSCDLVFFFAQKNTLVVVPLSWIGFVIALGTIWWMHRMLSGELIFPHLSSLLHTMEVPTNLAAFLENQLPKIQTAKLEGGSHRKTQLRKPHPYDILIKNIHQPYILMIKKNKPSIVCHQHLALLFVQIQDVTASPQPSWSSAPGVPEHPELQGC